MTDQHTINRRQFLRKVTSTVASSVTLVAASSTIAKANVIDVSENNGKAAVPSTKGYQRTEHVDTYYQLADF
ncbi:MAG: Tat pathway signal protein [Gammaproteobacteria bacterium]|nr:Tat pathway signal protein [Gammaproteobacteria bacterium]